MCGVIHDSHKIYHMCMKCDNLNAAADFFLFKTFHKNKDLGPKSSVTYLIKDIKAALASLSSG